MDCFLLYGTVSISHLSQSEILTLLTLFSGPFLKYQVPSSRCMAVGIKHFTAHIAETETTSPLYSFILHLLISLI